MRRELCFEGLFCGELILEGRIGLVCFMLLTEYVKDCIGWWVLGRRLVY